MKPCSFEDRVMAAAQGGEWNDELRDHSASCGRCAETMVVAAALWCDAESMAVDDAILPDPRAIWLRSRLEERRTKAARATSIITWMQRSAVLLGAALAVVFAPTVSGNFGEMFKGISLPALLSDVPLAISAPGAIFLLSFGVMALMVLWSELVESG